MTADAKMIRWWQDRRRVWSGFTGLPNRLVDSPAFCALTTAASVRCLVWFWREARYEKMRKRRPGKDTPIGRIDKIVNNGKISFTYMIASYLGMNARRFSRALKELHRLGFIDVAHLGRGVKGDYTKYALSSRWQAYGTPDWKETPFPENFAEGFRPTTRKKNNRHERPLLTDVRLRYKVAEMSDNGWPCPLNMVPGSDSKRTSASVSSDLCHPYKGIRRDSACASRIPLPLKPWRPPKGEMLENVVEIMRQRPDPRADDRRFVSFLVDQLDDVQRGRLNAERVRFGLIDRYGFDGWTADLLFGVGGLIGPKTGG